MGIERILLNLNPVQNQFIPFESLVRSFLVGNKGILDNMYHFYFIIPKIGRFYFAERLEGSLLGDIRHNCPD